MGGVPTSPPFTSPTMDTSSVATANALRSTWLETKSSPAFLGDTLADSGKYKNPCLTSHCSLVAATARLRNGQIIIYGYERSNPQKAYSVRFPETSSLPYKLILKASAGKDSSGHRKMKFWASTDGVMHVIVGAFSDHMFTSVDLDLHMQPHSGVDAVAIAVSIRDLIDRAREVQRREAELRSLLTSRLLGSSR